MLKKLILLFVLVYSSSIGAKAQTEKLVRLSNEKFTFGNYEGALDDYLALLEQDKDNPKYIYRLAVCYLNTNIDKTKAISYLEKLIKENKVETNNVYYLLGRAYHFALRFDEAIKMYNFFKEAEKGNTANLHDVEKQIEYCYNAKELIKFPLDVTFENLGKNINSAYADYYPFVPADESFIIFNTKRDDGAGSKLDGSFMSNVYISRVKNGIFGEARSLGETVNTRDGDEEVIGLSNDGDLALFYYDNSNGYGDIYLGSVDKNMKKPMKLPKEINSKDVEIAASITADGEVIYFASNRPGGFGGVDIYMSRKLPTGTWGPAQNLGPSINTPHDEDFPNISSDGKTLYFSSKGHTSMGGYDIFRAEWDTPAKNWAKVKNIGYPVNTPDDDMNLRMSETERNGYISALRKGGLGDLDIYKVTFNKVEPKYVVIKGLLSSADSTKTLDDILISVTDNQTQDIYGDYLPNMQTGRYIIILPPGNFNIFIDVPGFKVVSEDIKIEDISSIETEIIKDIALVPK